MRGSPKRQHSSAAAMPHRRGEEYVELASNDDEVRAEQWAHVAAELADALAAVLAARPPSAGLAGEMEFAGCDALDDFEAIRRRFAEAGVADPGVLFRGYLVAASELAASLRKLAGVLPESSPQRARARAALAGFARLRTVDAPATGAVA